MAEKRKPPTATSTLLTAVAWAAVLGFWWNWTAGVGAAALVCLLSVAALAVEVKYPPPTPPPAIDPFAPDTVALYRLFNDVGALLYVGISDTPKRRFQEHGADKDWWRQVDYWTVEWHPDRSRALAAEAAAIVKEVPAYNSAGMPTSNRTLEFWRTLFEAGCYPSVLQLEELFLLHRRMSSLPGNAVRMCSPSAIEEVYEYAKGRASGMVLRRHKCFIKEWEAERETARRRRRQQAESMLALPSAPPRDNTWPGRRLGVKSRSRGRG